jgi:hypothetical protein
VARQELPELLARAQQGLQDYLALTELQGLLDCAERRVARAFKASKARLGNKVLLGLEHLELRELRDNKAQSGQKVLLEWLALAELQD